MTEQTQSNMKVYELAKELGMDSIALLDKLKEINVEVKNHMSSLEAAQTEAIRAFFKKSQGESKKTATKTVARRSASSTAAKAVASATAPAGATAEKPKVVRAAVPASTATEEAKATKASVTPKVSAKPAATPSEDEAPTKRKIIKRRVATDGTETTTVEAAPKVESAASSATQESHADATETNAEQNPGSNEAELAGQEASAVSQTPIETYTPKLNAPGTRAKPAAPAARSLEKDELMDEFVSRRLKIVQQAPPNSPDVVYRTPSNARPKTARPAGSTDATYREEPNPAAKLEMFNPITSVSNKEDEGKRRGGAFKKPAEEAIRIADFRKREMVFQPKRKKLPPGKQIKQTLITTPSAEKRKIRIEDKIIVSELAQRMGEKANTILGKLMNLGSMVTINQTIDFDTATLIANEFGWEVENIAFDEKKALAAVDADEHLKPRPPVITIMGHVDHGKTSLLDAIRNANVAGGEAGGITQHIGAYSVTVDGKNLTFLDTPGHEAFAAMRSRGANLTDIVVLVVAGDDSIMPQTKEAIAHAQAAEVPMIVACNKMDKPDANLERVKKDLSANNVLVEDWGGEVPLVPISALKKTGLKELLETISVQAEVLELKANPDRRAEGTVLEARMEKGRGPVADLLVTAGTLKAGDYVVAGTTYGRLRAMTNDKGQNVKEVLPGYPVEVFGLEEVPSAGENFYVVADEDAAREIIESRKKKIQEQKAADLAPKPMSLDDLMSKLPTPGLKELNVIIKTDVYGSAEAIKEAINKIVSDKVKAKILSCGVGVITENDVLFAKSANARIYGFGVKPDSKARDTAKRENITVQHNTIIYELLDDVKLAMEALLDPIKVERYLGRAEVKQAFTVSKIGLIAGSMVTDGKVVRNEHGRVTRGKTTVVEGKIVSLKRFKDDASETIKGQECGIGVQGYTDIQAGDMIEIFHLELQKQTL